MPGTEAQIIVIADDLSGAAEIAGIGFAHGMSAEVQREFDSSSKAQLIAVDTDSRGLTAAEAAERVRQLALRMVATEPAWMFKKVDSVLRGNPRVEIEAILQATGRRRAILVPANPSRGRIIRGGKSRIDGVPLDQTSFARDPDYPRQSCDVQALLGRSNHESLDILIPDVENESQLDQLACQCDSTTIAAGAADFFAALLKVRCHTSPSTLPTTLVLPPPALLVCGSIVAWPERLVACEAARIPIHLINGPEWWPGSQGKRIARFVTGLLAIGSEIHPDPHQALRLLSLKASLAIAGFQVKSLLAEGGATASAIAAEMNWTRFQVVANAPAGVGALQPFASNASVAPLVFIKPGSYAWPAEIWQAFCECRHHREAR